MVYKFIYFLILIFFLSGCTEEFTPTTKNENKNLVIEATLTNELKKHEIKISRTFDFQSDTINFERGAEVQIIDDQGKVYNFEFNQDKNLYVSTEAFKALPNRSYHLYIATNDGHSYRTEPQTLPSVSDLELNVEAGNLNGDFGLMVKANSYDPTNESEFYRFKYEETYKITLPKWGPNKGVVTGPKSVTTEPREDLSKVCYNTVESKEFLLTSNTALDEDRVRDFLVSFTPVTSYKLAEKYSILVQQYVENQEAYFYYKTLNEISTSNNNQFSPKQPGYIESNIIPQNYPNEQVVGYFDVASVSEKRIFVEWQDYFSSYTYPDYFSDCESLFYDRTDTEPSPGHEPEIIKLINLIQSSRYILRGRSNDIFEMVPVECSSCRAFTYSEKPDFWE